MAEPAEIHKFLEATVPGYQRRDLIAVIKFFIDEMGGSNKKPLKYLKHLPSWNSFKEFVAYDWQGDVIEDKPIKQEKRAAQPGNCSCGGKWVKRQNRAEGNFFYGCSRYPKCKQTKNIAA